MEYSIPTPSQIVLNLIPSVPSQTISQYYPINVVYIAPKLESEKTGSGTSVDPYRVTTSDDFDNVFKKHYGTPTNFKLYPGNYYTKGTWNFKEQGYCYFSSYSSIEGFSSDTTVIHLSNDAIFEPDGVSRKDTNLFWVGEMGLNNTNMSVKNITFHGHCETFGPSKYIGGLRVFGNNSIVDNVIIRGIRGSFSDKHESFGISTINNSSGTWQGYDGGTIVTNCVVTDVPPYSYISAFSHGYRSLGRPILPSSFINCKAFLTLDNHFAYSGCCQTTVRDCYCDGANYAIYNDTDDVNGWLIDGNTFNIQYCGIFIASTQPNMPRCNIKVINNTFKYGSKKPTSYIGLAILDSTTITQCSNIVIEGNTFITTLPDPNRFTIASISSPKLKSSRVTNNIVPQVTYQHIINTPVSELNILRNWSIQGGLFSTTFPALS